MQDYILIPISKHEFKEMIKDSLREALNEQPPTQSQSEAEIFLSVKEASTFLKLAPQTLYGFTSKNMIPFIKRGKKLYFSKKELLIWLQQGRHKTVLEIQSEVNQTR
jgi:excisionase family DNA binding protein